MRAVKTFLHQAPMCGSERERVAVPALLCRRQSERVMVVTTSPPGSTARWQKRARGWTLCDFCDNG
jgi:hypothetical protein